VTKERVKYRSLLDSINSPILALKKDFSILYCNQAYARLAGKTVSELEGENLLEIFPGGEDTPCCLAYYEVLETGQTRMVEQRTGNRLFREQIYPTPFGLLSTAEDISEERRSEEAIRAFVSEPRVIFDELHDAVVISDVTGNCLVDVNRTACSMFGYTREEMLRLNLDDLAAGEPPYSRENLLDWAKKSNELSARQFEYKCRDKNGRVFWTEMKMKRLFIAEQVRLLAVIKEISQEKYKEKDLRESQELYRDLFDNSPDFMFIHDLDGNFLAVNQAAERITGFWPEELLKMKFSQLLSSESRPILSTIRYKKLGKNENRTFEVEIGTKFNGRVFLEVSIWPVYRDNKLKAIRGIAHDTTKRKLDEERLKKSELKLLSFIDYLPDATLAIDLEGRVVVWNQAMERLTGIKASEMLGKGDYEYGLAFYNSRRPIMVDLVLRPDEVKKFYSVIEKDNLTIISEFDTPHLRGEGHYLWGQALCWFDQEGNLLGAIESLRDITERYKSEQANRKKYDELAEQLECLQALENKRSGFSCSCNREGEISWISKRVSNALGFTPQELRGSKFSLLINEGDRKIWEKEIQKAQQEKEFAGFNLSFVRQDDTLYPAQVRLKPLLAEEELAGFLLEVEEKDE